MSTPTQGLRLVGFTMVAALLAMVLMQVVSFGATARASALSSAAAPAPTPASAPEDENPHFWRPRVTSVAVFKNGLGFFVREGEVALRDGWCLAREVPPATFGTLAVYSHSAAEMVEVVGSGPGEVVEFDGTDVPKDEATKRTRLEAALNLKVELTYIWKATERTAAGRLVSVGPQFAILENDSGSFGVAIEGIRKMQVLELPVRVHVSGQDNKALDRVKLGMAYLRRGITWIPEYTLRVLDDDTAELTLRGTLVNEAEDLVHCDVNFVVGVPHFVHTDYLVPAAVGQVIRTIGAAVAPREVQTQIASRAAITSNAFAADQFAGGAAVVERPAGAPADVRGALGNLPQMEAAGGADFTVYTKKDLTVRRGEKAIVTLFTVKIKYAHLYRWSPPEPVQHLLVLRNEAPSAWTTGPCLAVSAAGPLSEDLLRYTSRGGNCEIPVTAAMNVATDQTEAETDRKLKAHEPAHDFWLDLVTVEGQLKVRNFERRPVDIIVTAKVPGKPTDTSDGGVPTIDTTKLQLQERAATIRWTLHLGAGETKTVTYKYERYVPSR